MHLYPPPLTPPVYLGKLLHYPSLGIQNAFIPANLVTCPKADAANCLCSAAVLLCCCSPAFEQAKAQENYEHMVAQQAGQPKGRRFAAANEFQQQVQQQRAREEEEEMKKRVSGKCTVCLASWIMHFAFAV
jgi:hypothetical protein